MPINEWRRWCTMFVASDPDLGEPVTKKQLVRALLSSLFFELCCCVIAPIPSVLPSLFSLEYFTFCIAISASVKKQMAVPGKLLPVGLILDIYY